MEEVCALGLAAPMMKLMTRLLRYLKAHPLVWLTPTFFLTVGIGWIAYKLAGTPANPFIYDL